MRPLQSKQNVLKCPLDEVFGTQASVRILRVLADETLGPISTSEVADRCGITVAGARRALIKLSKTGLVQLVGSPHPQHVLNENNVLSEAVRELFYRESERYQEFITKLRKILSEFKEITLAWIDNSPSSFGEPIQLGIVSEGKSLSYLGKEIIRRTSELEHEFDVMLDVRTFSENEAKQLHKPEPTSEFVYGYTRPERLHSKHDHRSHDERARRANDVIVKLVDRNPSLVSRASKHVDRLLREDQGTATNDIKEWQDILKNYSRQRLKDFLVADSPRADRLRQSSPFFAVLNSEEREEVFEEMERSR